MPDLKEAIRATVDNNDYADVVIKVKKVADDGITHEIPASKYVLSIRSKVFHNMFYGPFKEGLDSDSITTRTVSVPDDISHDTMQSLIHFLYTDEVRKLDKNGEILNEDEPQQQRRNKVFGFDDDPVSLTKLYNAAHYYQIEELMETILKKFEYGYYSRSLSIGDLIQCACIVVDSNNSDDATIDKENNNIGRKGTLLKAIQDHLDEYFRNSKEWDASELDPLMGVSSSNISRIFNSHTVPFLLDYHRNPPKGEWLLLLEAWVKHSPKTNTSVAQDVLKTISQSRIDFDLLMEMYDNSNGEENPFITKDIAFEIMRKKMALEERLKNPSKKRRKSS